MNHQLPIALTALVLAFSACNSNDDKEKKGIHVTSIELNKYTMVLEEGFSERLQATVKPDNAAWNMTFLWESSNEGVATVEYDGIVEALSPGTATITVTTDQVIKASCIVEVVAATELSVVGTATDADNNAYQLVRKDDKVYRLITDGKRKMLVDTNT